MTNLPITAPKETRAIATLVCTACGAPGEGSCGCGAPYVSPGQRAAEAIRQNPERSNVAIAEELGVDEGTIRYQRKKLTSEISDVQPRTGRDGKTRRMPRKPKIPASTKL